MDELILELKEEIIKVTYEQFQKDTYYLGTALATMDLLNSHIAIIGDNSYQWLTTYLTVLKGNGVFIPIDKELTKNEIFNVLRSSDSEVIFYAAKYEKYIEECKQEVPQIHYYIGLQKEDDDAISLSFEKLLKKGQKEYEAGNTSYVEMEHQDTNCLKMLVYTSGTTGIAKGVKI